MPGAGNSRAEAQVVSSTTGVERIKIQVPGAAGSTLVSQWLEKEITVANLLDSATPVLNATTLNLGTATGTAGTLNLFPGTTTTGELQLVATANSGNTVTEITNAAQSGARVYTIPDAGSSTTFVMAAGAQTVAGVKTFSSQVTTPAGVGVTVTAGSNAKQGTATLSSGTVTVSNTSVTANSKIYLTRTSINGSTALGELIIGTITASTSFVITAVIVATPGSTQTGDTSIVEYLIVEAA